MRIKLDGPNIKREYNMDGLTHVAAACYMGSDSHGWPLVFLFDKMEDENTALYVQAKSVLDLKFLKHGES